MNAVRRWGMKVMMASACLLAGATTANAAAPADVDWRDADWGPFFDKADARGTLVIVDERTSPPRKRVYNRARAAQRYAPASTYKIAHTLFALDAKLVTDEFQVFRWDGVPHAFAGHNQDQTLRSAMRYSTLWVYQGFARQLGERRARDYLRQIAYGNADPTTSHGDYWVDGNLRISAFEQVAFLRQLYRNALPFQGAHQRLVKDVMIREATPTWILRAKTGWEGRYGWWVGWVETDDGAVFFALNIDTPQRLDDLPKREQIGRAVLQSMGLLGTD